MKTERAARTFRQISFDNTILKVATGALMISMCWMQFTLATRDEAVILVPPFQNETIEFINGRANRDYYQQWAWSVAMLAGNITPGNADFVRGEFERISTPALYRKLMSTVDVEIQNIVRDNAIVTFTPRAVIYDPELNRFFVTGTQSIGGPGLRRAVDKQMTYELGFTTERLRIYLDSYAIYEGKPMTAETRDQEMDKREAQERAAR
ncbi:type IV conjugative transfer system protein TraE [Paracoccus sp. 1_MG-2023]|uniref:type IV conjugative transfer system protein TraE n=1 Tax=unclassified Paracoccus (in: a-proteobacteria) TaxID=2688777 RepID=UPI001C082030|nr:type IV conjugative transfer system protein TraE [Paracoccus sp. 1_MG-2023]MBU2959157.1 type IV conjugative transfer system protein TraE [Paracoccus sp. C2R09]MDO6669440.1 type IV conjugative transfer system protein TraE [Paracoccus sp. 1_MG-2023]